MRWEVIMSPARHTSVFGSSSSSRSASTLYQPHVHLSSYQHTSLQRTLIRSDLVHRRRILIFIVRVLQRFRIRQHRLFLAVEPQLPIPARAVAMRCARFRLGALGSCAFLCCCGLCHYGCFCLWRGGAVAGFGHGGRECVWRMGVCNATSEERKLVARKRNALIPQGSRQKVTLFANRLASHALRLRERACDAAAAAARGGVGSRMRES